MLTNIIRRTLVIAIAWITFAPSSFSSATGVGQPSHEVLRVFLVLMFLGLSINKIWKVLKFGAYTYRKKALDEGHDLRAEEAGIPKWAADLMVKEAGLWKRLIRRISGRS